MDFEDGKNNGIYRSHPDGSEKQHIISVSKITFRGSETGKKCYSILILQEGIGKSGIRGIAIDWVGKNLYFTNVFPHENLIEVSDS